MVLLANIRINMIKEETPQYIVNLEISLKSLIKEEVGNLAASTARGFRVIDKKFEEMDERLDDIDSKLAEHDVEFEGINNRLDRIESDVRDTKESVSKIEGHIGRYEVRAQNIEAILLEDHKPRIKELERIVFAK